MLEVKASFGAFAFGVRSCRASVCRQVRVVAFPLLDCAAVDSVQSALIYPERLRGRRTMTAPLSTRRSLALGPRMSLALFAVALLMLPAWPSSASAASLEDIKKRGYMIVATEDDYPPFEFVVDGKPMGYDHELLTILRKSAGFEVRQEILPWQGILPGVASGKYDVALSAAVITDERVKSLDFTMPIAESTMAYVKRKGDGSIKSLMDFLNAFLAQQKTNGTYKQLQAKWLKITFEDLPNQPMLPGDRPIK